MKKEEEEKLFNLLDRLRADIGMLVDRMKFNQMCADSLEERVSDIEDWLQNGTVQVDTDFDLD